MTRFKPERCRTRTRGKLGLATALVLAATLAGCSPPETGLPPDTARQFQERVLAVSEAANANDHSTALKTLESLEGDVAAAAGTGLVSGERRRRILTSITAVRADLTAAIDNAAAAAKAAAEAAAAAAAEADQARAQAEAEAEAAAAASTAQQYTAPGVAAPAPAPANAPEQKRGNEGKGKEKNG